MGTLGRQLERLRLLQGWSPQQLSEYSEISEQAIRDIERGLTKRANSNTIRRLAEALKVAPEDLVGHDMPIYMPRSLEAGPIPLWFEELNRPEVRRGMLELVCPALASDPPEVTRFIDHLEILGDFRWLNEPSHIETSTMEFRDVWSDRGFFIPYEAVLLRFDKAGRQVDRLFEVDATKLNSPAYIAVVKQVLLRHRALGLHPKIIPADEARSLHADLGARCDSIVICDAASILIANYPQSREPVYIRSDNRDFSARASNVFRQYWRDYREADAFLQLYPASEREEKNAEREAEEVQRAFGLWRSLKR